MHYTVLLYYRYVAIPDPEAEREIQVRLCSGLGLKGRILIGSEGINGTVAGTKEATQSYREAMDARPLMRGIDYKVNTSQQLPFPRLRVRVRSEIVALGETVDLNDTANHLSPEEFNQLIQDPSVVLFDARNNYESAIGKFEGAITPDIGLFRELPAVLDTYDSLRDKKIVTYCTGGIRCEKASALMKQHGFTNVYQLDGGIIKYAQTYPQGAFQGECFVFDDRMKVSFREDPELLGACLHCKTPTNDYYNCGYKPCNRLILLCEGCNPDDPVCSVECRAKMRLRETRV